MLLTPVYEAEFLGFSYGFRLGRGQRDALDALAYGIKGRYIWWILDADIRSFFDTFSHDWLIRFVEHRVADTRIIRLIRKWLKAGVLEQGAWSETKESTPQGAVISPLLEHRLHLRAEPLKAAAHVGDVSGQPDACSWGKLDHLLKLSRMQCSKAASAPDSTLILALPGSSMWIVPVAEGL